MNIKYLPGLIAFLCGTSNFAFAEKVDTPQLLLAKEYKQETDISQFWISEKLDGVRAFWNGKQLITRQGNTLNAPSWFTKDFPSSHLDGELWIARRLFEKLSGTVRKNEPVESEWKLVKYMVFDKPDSLQSFTNRITELKTTIKQSNSPYLRLVEQQKVKSQKDLDRLLNSVIAKGGEGLMLHRGDSLYQGKRSNDLQKLKTHQDAEAKVVAHLPARGKFEGMMGSLLVETNEGKQFKIGTGFTIHQRKNPPEIGDIITFRYRGFTNKGTPKFASFLRIREDF
ncbi:MAG: DNA ligase [Kangiellaceae bacterium]|nr:DNA ligase [Kangiellaceae bacterium]MCW9000824.1 DNA ligase [Kangiellaceae bacterium]